MALFHPICLTPSPMSGPIPISIANASSLQTLDLGHQNILVGQVPNLGKLHDLQQFR
jgi:hypothetical protein